MELLIAILIALGSLTSPEAYTKEYEIHNQQDIERAEYIIESEQYTKTSTGGVIVNQDIEG